MDKATRVIWIHSESIRMIDAKLMVFRKYEQKLCREKILMHHEYEEDIDDILMLSGRQKLDYLYEKTISQKEKVPDQSLHQILLEAADRALTKREIRNVCESVYIQHGGYHVGRVGYSAYICHSKFTVDEIKAELVQETLKETAILFGAQIGQGISRHIIPDIQETLDDKFSELRKNISDELYPIIGLVVQPFLVRILIRLRDMIYSIWSVVVVFFLSVNINSQDWRWSVADEIYGVVSRNKLPIVREILPHVKGMCAITRNDIESVCRRIEEFKQEIVLSDQEKSK